MDTPSNTSSPTTSVNMFRNGPPNNEYIKSHKNIFLSYTDGTNTFQHGYLGDNDTFLVGNIHLYYGKAIQVKSVFLHLRGTEKTFWQKSQARTKSVYSGEHTLVDQTNKVWEAFDDSEEVSMLDIPFKVQLPYNLPDSINTDIGSVKYVLQATVNTKKGFFSQQSTIKVNCPLRRTLTLDNEQIPPYKLSGQTPSGIDYTFLLPPNKSFNIGSYVSIPLKLKFLRPNIGVEKIDISLKTCMNFQSTTQGEIKQSAQKIMNATVSRSELLYSKPTTSSHFGECTHTLNLFVPKNVQPTYQGRFISIAHVFSVHFYLWGFESDFRLEENVRICYIVEKFPQNSQSQQPASIAPLNALHYNTSNLSVASYNNPSPSPPVTPQVSPALPSRQHVPNPPPIAYMNDGSHMVPIDATYYQFSNQQHIHERRLSDKPFDGYDGPQPLLYHLPSTSSSNVGGYFHHQLVKSERCDMRRDSGTSTPSKEFEAISNPSQNDIVNGYTPYPTHLSPPPYRQAMTKQQEVVSDK